MGVLDRFRFAAQVATQEETRAEFIIDQTSIDPALFGLAAYEATLTPPGRVSRREAMQVPAVKRARDIICGTLATLPLVQLNPKLEVVSSSLLEQPEVDVPRSVTMAYTYEDLFFESEAWWQVIVADYAGWPVKVKRLQLHEVDVQADGRVFVNGRYVPDGQLIRFTSLNDPLLVVAARAIRTAIILDKTAYNYAQNPSPKEYFTSEYDVPTEQVTEYLTQWRETRQTTSTGYINPAMKLQQMQSWSPKDLQLVEARDYAVKEIARVTGLDPEDLAVSTTSRTYQNGVDRRKSLIDFTLGHYVSAVQDRLSMGDVTPRGSRVRTDFNAFLRSDEKERMDIYQAGIEIGLYPVEEAQRREELPAYKKPKADPPPVIQQQPDPQHTNPQEPQP